MLKRSFQRSSATGSLVAGSSEANDSPKANDAYTKSIQDILDQKRIKTFKNQYSNQNKLKGAAQTAEQSFHHHYGNRKASSQNPYLGSFEETGSPDVLQKQK